MILPRMGLEVRAYSLYLSTKERKGKWPRRASTISTSRTSPKIPASPMRVWHNFSQSLEKYKMHQSWEMKMENLKVLDLFASLTQMLLNWLLKLFFKLRITMKRMRANKLPNLQIFMSEKQKRSSKEIMSSLCRTLNIKSPSCFSVCSSRISHSEQLKMS